MVKRKPSGSKTRHIPAEAARAADAKADGSWFSPAAIRETIESVIIAFVLAFLFRTFEAEAFVIPTGSMAPTLMGKHKDLECPMCHYRYQVSASDRQDSEVASNVFRSTCPMCRYTADVTPQNAQKKPYPSYDGDRILVAKFPYEFADPKRWDVIVFKYPGNATMNYIKRLVGLPGETIRIHCGDLWIHEAGDPEGKFKIARKPPEKLLAMLQPVYDNDLAPTITGKLGWPARWTPEPGPGENSWTNGKDKENGDLSSFEIDHGPKGEAWIRYRHRVPTHAEWGRRKANNPEIAKEPPADSVLPQLISDFTAYNTSLNDQSPPDRFSESLIERGCGLHWVGDLAVQFELESRAASGKVVAELIKGGRQFQCHFDLSTGKTELTISGLEPEAAGYRRTATTAVAGPGSHKIIFANVDDELNLWVDGKLVAFQDPARPDAPPRRDGASEFDWAEHPNQYNSALLNDHVPTPADLSPVGIAAEEASVKVSHIKVLRDVYYIAVFGHGRGLRESPLKDFKDSDSPLKKFLWDELRPNEGEPVWPKYVPDLTKPETWPEFFRDDNMKQVEIPLKPADPARPERDDQFFVLGDNSGQSADGRLWVGQWWVERELLIGKALFIYWPHGWAIPYLRLPVNPIPHFGRMHLVR